MSQGLALAVNGQADVWEDKDRRGGTGTGRMTQPGAGGGWGGWSRAVREATGAMSGAEQDKAAGRGGGSCGQEGAAGTEAGTAAGRQPGRRASCAPRAQPAPAAGREQPRAAV